MTLAERTGAVIVNADSAQVYRDLPVLSAAPSEEDRERAEHRLFGVLDASRSCSAAEWAEMAKREIADIHAGNRLPILVGGTGLYLRTLLEGIAPVPPIDPDVRRHVRSAAVEQNRLALKRLDPEAAARLNSSDTTRIARALEVVRSTGRTLKAWHAEREGGIAGAIELRALILLPPREWLYSRCDERFVAMFEGGAFVEVERLLARGLDPRLPAMRAIGVREIAACLRGDLSRERAIASGQQATRNYAKRQYTWFAHQPPPEWPRFREPLEGADVGRALALLTSSS